MGERQRGVGKGGDREAEKGGAGSILATITINKPDSLSRCVCVSPQVV